MKSFFSLLFCCLALSSFAQKNNTDTISDEVLQYINYMDSINTAMRYEKGNVKIQNGMIDMKIPAGFKYLNVAQSKYIIEDVWGNLPQDNLQGMLFPENSDPFDDSSYAFIITYNPIGFVKDADAGDINYDDMMKEMKKDEIKENEERAAAGVRALNTVGWAAKPYYDEKNKVLHWALNLKSAEATENTLNYRVMILGRKGLLSMNAVAPIYALDSVRNHIDEVLAMPQFTAGNKYSDFDPKVDDVAAWTIGGLVAGKVLAKVGFLAIILKYLKFILLGIAAVGGGVWKWITGRRKRKEELEYNAAPVAENEPTV
ncbi:MAG: DUF2167 domain-containing protein [Chitinophagaceae bacterium]|nr:DUF2167 domain-containing protein [Chitinophagaceae bacterium]